MYDKYHLSRCDAMEWLAEHYPAFPTSMPDVPMRVDWCSENLLKGGRSSFSWMERWHSLTVCLRVSALKIWKVLGCRRYRYDLHIRRITNPHLAGFSLSGVCMHANPIIWLLVGVMALSAISSLIHMSEGLLWLNLLWAQS